MKKARLRSKPSSANEPLPDLLEQAVDCCENINAIAGLLSSCRESELDAKTVLRAGHLIHLQALELGRDLERIFQQLPKSAWTG